MEDRVRFESTDNGNAPPPSYNTIVEDAKDAPKTFLSYSPYDVSPRLWLRVGTTLHPCSTPDSLMFANMSWRSLLLTAFYCFLPTTTVAQDRSLSDLLAASGVVPAGTEGILAEVLLEAANTTSNGLVEALARPGIEELQRTDPERYYAGLSPAVYPSRMLRPFRKRGRGDGNADGVM